MDLSSFIHSTRIMFFDKTITKPQALEQLSACAAQAPEITDTVAFRNAIFQREQVSSTGIGKGVAVPHAKIETNNGFTITIGISKKGIQYDAIDALPVHVLFMIAATDQERKTYLQLLATVANQLKQQSVYEKLCKSDCPDAVFAALNL